MSSGVFTSSGGILITLPDSKWSFISVCAIALKGNSKTLIAIILSFFITVCKYKTNLHCIQIFIIFLRTHNFFLFKKVLQLLFYFLTSQATGEDGAIGGEEDDFGNSLNAVEISRYFLRVEDLRIRYLHFIDGFQ